MKIIYISTVTSKKLMNKIIEESKNKPLQSIQKFHRLICEGFAKNNVEIKTYSSIPMSRKISSKFIWFNKKEKENGVEYNYIPFINIKIIRQICTFIGMTFNIIKECIKNKKQKVFICDILNTTISSTTLVLSKIFRFKCIAIVTDLPRDMTNARKLSGKINECLQSKYDGYIILTEAMNEIVNTNKKPSVVIEGIADSEIIRENENIEKYKEKVCMYAGGLYEKYGVKALIEAFLAIENKDIRLHLYGAGDLEDYIKKLKDDRVKYYGVVKNDVIVEEEKKATLLINPRFTSDEYTKYSFPSKNIEYMASGTPLLTTKLSGMPKEYYEYVYLFEDEKVDGYLQAMKKVLTLDSGELRKKGKSAKEFIIQYKNNIKQSKRILEMIDLEK